MRRIIIAPAMVALLALTLIPGVTLTRVKADKKNDRWVEPVDSFVPGRILVGFHSTISADHARQVIGALGARDADEIPGIGVHILDLPYQASEQVFLKAFQARPEVEFAEVDRILPPDEVIPNDPNYKSEWHLPKIGGPAAWSATTGSNNVTIAILDTGVDGTHPDLAPKMVPGWNFYDNNSNTSDVYGHGTAVAGSAAAASDNNRGVASVAWGSMIMPIRVSDVNGYGSTSAMGKGLTWAADHGARVANISYRVSTSSTIASSAKYFQGKGGVVTISAGNESTFDAAADNPYVLTVSATDSGDKITSWSNTGNLIDVAAPGLGIYTTNRGGGYGSWWGTSFSAPIVAGVAALVISANPNLSGGQAQDIIRQSADDLGAVGWDTTYGQGRVNAGRAVSLALDSGATDMTPPTASITSPSTGAIVAGTVNIGVNASDNIAVTSVNVSVDGILLGTAQTGPCAFLWDTFTVSDGAHVLTAVVADAAGNSSSTSVAITVRNNGDTTAPAVNIASPAEGSSAGTNVSVLVSTSDDVGVVRVELYVDGLLTASSSSAPFTTKWNTRKAASGAHSLQCRAYDGAGNVGFSQVITVNR